MHSFWSLVVEPGKSYKKIVESGINVTRVALDTSKATSQAHEGLVQVLLEYEGKTMTVANLSIKHAIFQAQLDLLFQCGEEIAFTTSGAKLPITLTGISGADDDDEDELGMDEEDESWVDEMEDFSNAQESGGSGKKRKMTNQDSRSKAAKLNNGQKHCLSTLKDQEFVSDDSEDESYNPTADIANDTADDKLINDSQISADFTADDTESDDEEEDSDEEEDEEECEEEEEEEEEDEDDSLDEEMEDEEEESDEDEEEEMEESPVKPKKSMNGLPEKKQKKDKQLAAPAESSKQVSTPKQSKLEKIKSKDAAKLTPVTKGGPKESNNTTPAKDKKTPGKEAKKDPKSPKTENKENVATPKQKKNKEIKALKGSEQKTPKQLRAGGVLIEDIAVGTGTTAKNSSMVSVYYEGRLKNGKVFDKTVSGPPFKFRLGRGEVIKGWDVGVAGMQVGGKRRISIPPNMGYGKSGSAPVIPPNAHLSFDITLINCH